ncbi:MAG: efflux RND transporter periplasmic adaptor subunit [candidate division Zixibacteria bacterium]|nr:efflux RND transporter periplasmic adaptor subunit [candidate division Zixibacteria bacterium]
MKLKSKKTLFIGLGVVVVAAIVILNLTASNGNETSVQADLAYVDDISEIVTASGRIQPQTKVDITAEVSAQIVEIYISEGDLVVKGQPLLLLDTIQLRADVAQARFSLEEILARTEAARSQFKQSELEFERQSRLYDKELTSETVYTNVKFASENSKANLEAMVAQSKTGRARLEQAADRLSKTRIMAPMDGVITYLNAEVGEIAQAQTSFTQGKTLMTVADLSVFEVEVDVDETEIAMLNVGQETEIRVDAYRDTSFVGEVVEIGNSATITGQGTENYTTSFRVKVRFAETDAVLRPGMSATVDVTTDRVEDALLIPYASVVTREIDVDSLQAKDDDDDSGGLVQTVNAAEADDVTEEEVSDEKKKKSEKVKKTGVFVISDGIARFVEVTTGIADERNLVALSGVNEGDTIISGTFQTLRKLSDSDEVKIDELSLEKMENGDH